MHVPFGQLFPSNICYAHIGSEILRFARTTSDINTLPKLANQLLKRMQKQSSIVYCLLFNLNFLFCIVIFILFFINLSTYLYIYLFIYLFFFFRLYIYIIKLLFSTCSCHGSEFYFCVISRSMVAINRLRIPVVPVCRVLVFFPYWQNVG